MRLSRIHIFILIILPVVCLSLIVGCGGEKTTAKLEPLDDATIQSMRNASRLGYAAIEKGDLDSALVQFAEVARLAPSSPNAQYDIACAQAIANHPDEAIAALQKAADKGYSDWQWVNEDPDLIKLRDHADWEALITKMKANFAAQLKDLEGPLPSVSSAGDPVFTDIDTLDAYYNKTFWDTYRRCAVFPGSVKTKLCREITARRLAALQLFSKMHPAVADQYAADMSALHATTQLAGLQQQWIAGRPEAVAIATKIMSSYPDSAGAAEAALWNTKARVAEYVVVHDEIQPDEAARAVSDFIATADKLPDGRWKSEALAEAIVFKSGATPDIEELQPLVDRFLKGGRQRIREIEKGYELNELILRASGPVDFTATDIDGEEWTLDKLRGRVALLDFWATWCGPCVAEIPTLVELTKTYPTDKFIILGISQDSADRTSIDDFRAWMASRNMTWPQIYTGEGWGNQLAKAYTVPAIPFPVLLDADGHVVAAGGGARGEVLKELVKELLEEPS
ncbi:MAG: redoxin domain-containing protein [Candidatus Eisenbacteria bacterium]|uniref:Redoxin domain-containing protein n=1 Tax=Eiseniibacteriota bacterium TaxID=2212470 RepID=A0A948S0U2_UNCEI|nr:redoxin domain-containing protein [Candidatus Eisenbacteria bacterium]MBU1950677.1 redoxin domain-containing protein [Candidatus Eisenbacteria bacterium]MBU2693268.1 redoxin domain-containing protein [Candidatus Eisenbacteria bacterium]